MSRNWRMPWRASTRVARCMNERFSLAQVKAPGKAAMTLVAASRSAR
jgi:hypothetical protein